MDGGSYLLTINYAFLRYGCATGNYHIQWAGSLDQRSPGYAIAYIIFIIYPHIMVCHNIIFRARLTHPACDWNQRLSHSLPSTLYRLAHTRHQHFYCHPIVATLRDDQIGIAFARLDKVEMHGAHRFQILLYNRRQLTTAL